MRTERESLMAKDAFNKGGNATTIKKGASEKRVGPHVPMIGQKPPGASRRCIRVPGRARPTNAPDVVAPSFRSDVQKRLVRPYRFCSAWGALPARCGLLQHFSLFLSSPHLMRPGCPDGPLKEHGAWPTNAFTNTDGPRPGPGHPVRTAMGHPWER